MSHPRLDRGVPVPGRRSRVDRGSIAAAALRVGFENLSMTAVAAELGVAHPTLYRHVRDRNDLVAAAVDLLLHGVERPEPSGGWRDYLRRSAIAVFEVSISAPGMVDVLRRDPVAPAALVAWFAEITGRLVELGFAEGDALLASDLVVDLMADAAATGWLTADGHDQLVALGETWARHMPVARDALATAISDPVAWVHRKLDVVLDGIAASLAPGDRSG